jgi:hypothetical protein
MSIFPKRNSFLDWNPEPEALSRDRLRRSPLLIIFPLPSPHVMSKSWDKLAAVRARKELRRVRARNINGALEEAMGSGIKLDVSFGSGEMDVLKLELVFGIYNSLIVNK